MAQVGGIRRLRSWGVFGGLALLVLAPLLLPGYIMTLDMAFTPQLRMPTEVSSSYLFHAALHVLNTVLPSQLLQKALLFAILVLCGMGAYRLVRYLQAARPGQFDAWGAYIAGALYMINPFTYARFMVGQYAVLLGYALLPFFVHASLRFFDRPSRNRCLELTAWAVAISIVSIHTLGLLAVCIAVQLAIVVWRWRQGRPGLGAVVRYGAVAALLFLIVSSYWLAPILAGSDTQGRAVAAFNAADQQAFATAGGSAVKRISNVLQLRGFWAETRDLYLLPQSRLPGWPLVMLAIWALVGAGASVLWRGKQRAVAVLLAATGLAAVVLAATGVSGWLGRHLPLFAGYREPQKFIGLLALAYAVFAGIGTAAVLERASKRSKPTLLNLLMVALLLLPLLYTPTMFGGFSGQLRPRQYPADWYTINSRLNREPHSGAVLFLPWHLYMSFDFAGRIITNPAQDFFDRPVIASNQLEFMGASPTRPDAQKSLLSHDILLDAPKDVHLGARLSPLHIRYVLLAKDYDYQNYNYLTRQTDLVLIQETPHLKLYEVQTHE